MTFLLLFNLFSFVLSAFKANAVPYNYSASIECLENPHKPQYSGGIIINPDLNNGSHGWFQIGEAKIDFRELGGNKFVAARERKRSYDSVSQKLYLQKEMLYTFSAWLRVSEGTATVVAIFKTNGGYKHAGSIVAESKCWSMLKGGLTIDESGPAELYFESENTTVEIWVDSVSLQPFTEDEWKSHQDQSIQRMRKTIVRIRAVDTQGNNIPNATISIEQKKLGFPFGCAVESNILGNPAYQNWFTKRFTVTTFGNEMKWYSTEPVQGREDYSTADSMLRFFKQHGISVRGHNVVWDDPKYQLQWVKSLSGPNLYDAVKRRVYSVVSRYRDQLLGWDVVNENLHFSFFESNIGPNASELIYNLTHATDPGATLFMNDYNTIEDPRDLASSPARYLQKLREIQSFLSNPGIRMGIGLESHFGVPNIPYMRSALDTLAATGLPIWLTELDVGNVSGSQAVYLEQILREAKSHPQVKGIVMWSGWSPSGCYRMCLTDGNFNNLDTGNVVDKLLREWGGLGGRTTGFTDKDGVFETSLFHGDYKVKIAHPVMNSTATHSFKLSSEVVDDSKQPTTLVLGV